MDGSGSDTKDKRSDSDNAKSKDDTPTAATTTPSDTNKSPRKRRKVNHACVYCRRSHMTCDLERPCTRCVKRNIGHLCHDEPRDPDAKKPKGSHNAAARDSPDAQGPIEPNAPDMAPPTFNGNGAAAHGSKPGFGTAALSQATPLQLVSPNAVSGMQAGASGSNVSQYSGFSDAWLTAQNQFHDMHHYNPQYMLPQEVTSEFNLINEFLHSSLLDDGGNLADDQNLVFRSNQPPSQNDMAGFLGDNSGLLPPGTMQTGPMPPPNAEQSAAVGRPSNAAPQDRTREFYLQAADPTGPEDTPEARMQGVLKAKYDAGLLKPFNYIKGYARLSNYMTGHIAPESKKRILEELDKFRPEFREKMQGLTDIELVYVEMWFEKTLMEYDRVFAAMAVPACCWRRTGEIVRGNKGMAELIHVPVERLRDGKISLHEILTEQSLVRYWGEFRTIAFDPDHDALLTACALKNPDDRSNDPIVNCCFSFMVRRDDHKMGLVSQIEAIKSSILRNSSRDPQHRESLDHAGTDLWNWCTKRKRQYGPEKSALRDRFLALTRVYAFLMLALAQSGHSPNPGGLVRLRSLAIKTGRSCTIDGELENAAFVLQKAGEYNGLLQNTQDALPQAELEACKKSEAECLILRVALAWKDDKLDVAEFLYAKIEKLPQICDPVLVEKLSDTLFELGKGLSGKKDYPLATKWLKRAYSSINSQDLDRLSREAIELRLAISQALVQACLETGTTEAFEEAENLVGYLESVLGDKFVVLLLRLELLFRSPAEVFDHQACSNVIRRMIRSVDLSDQSFKVIVYNIRKLEEKSPNLARDVLDEFIVARIVRAQRDDWLSKVLILRVHMTASHEETPENLQELESILQEIESSTGKPLSATTALGAQTIIWKRVDAYLHQGQVDIAERWCRLALHTCLEQSGTLNNAKIARKRLLCALQMNNLDGAMEILRSMTPSARSDPMTMYLAYKLALRNGDRDMIKDCLDHISEASPKDPRYLYACCLDAQQAQDKLCTIEVLRHLVKRHEFGSAEPIHVPALLRLLIRLEISLVNSDPQTEIDHKSLVDDLCNAFEGVVVAIQRDLRDADGNKLFTIDELDWFCKNAYNLGLKNMATWEARQVIRMLRCCLAIIPHYPQDFSAEGSEDLSLRGMFCNFLIATMFIALARSEDHIETRLQDYLVMRDHVKLFDAALESASEKMAPEMKDDLRRKLSVLLEDLTSIIIKTQTCHDLSTLYAMTDCILRTQSVPDKVLYSTLRKLINNIWEMENFDSQKLGRYICCLLKATLPLEASFPLSVIEEACSLVKESAKQQTDRSLPRLELEWLTTTAFNHGIDLYGRHEDELSKRWIAHSFSLAHYCADGGELERQLHERHTNIRWDGLGPNVMVDDR
ncbi:meiosis protein SPO22/ZIP4 like-domain-containing protein [Xylariaceae sp. FL0804]|nr:meiosis protein SPO22/ZIP4 like-domain-containing protein [Xylariaceae sp. FL0804]